MSVDELRACGIAMALYPLSAFRAMNLAAQQVYAAIRRDGTQQSMVAQMQTRQELYEVLDYLQVERRIDQLLQRGTSNE
jgi:methylisocitrate lyase